MYQQTTGAELESSRTARFSTEFFEFGGPRRGEPWRIRHWLPLHPEHYCALVMPWTAYRRGPAGWGPVRDEPFEDILGAYEYVGLPVPKIVTIARWRADFDIVEQARELPPLVRAALDRFSSSSSTVFVRCQRGITTIHNWRIDRALFLELPDPFVEMPEPFGTMSIFPDRVPWFMHTRDDVPLIYLAGAPDLIETLQRLYPRRVIRVSADDLYY